MTRSANTPALEDVIAGIESAARLAGAEVEVTRSYPPWQPDLGSALLTTARTTFSRLNGSEPALEVVHGGLECAVIGARLPGVQMISIGPVIENPHAPGRARRDLQHAALLPAARRAPRRSLGLVGYEGQRQRRSSSFVSSTVTRPRWSATVPRRSSSRSARFTVAREVPAIAARSSCVSGTTPAPYVSASSQTRRRTRVSAST